MPIESGASTASRSRQASKIITNRPAGDRSAALRCIPTIAAYAHARVRLDPRLALSGSARARINRSAPACRRFSGWTAYADALQPV